MTRTGIELVKVERRRRWSRSEMRRLVATSLEPGVSGSEVAREAGLHVSQLFRWRRLLCERVEPPTSVPSLMPVAIVPRAILDACRTETGATPDPSTQRGH